MPLNINDIAHAVADLEKELILKEYQDLKPTSIDILRNDIQYFFETNKELFEPDFFENHFELAVKDAIRERLKEMKNISPAGITEAHRSSKIQTAFFFAIQNNLNEFEAKEKAYINKPKPLI